MIRRVGLTRLSLGVHQALVRLVAGTRFQQRAAASWLMRPMARRESRRLFDLAAGFVYSQVLSACLGSGLLERLLEQPCPVPELARDLGVPEQRLQRLVDAALALGLLRQRFGRLQLGLSGAALLGNPGVLAMIRHNGMLYLDLQDPVELLGKAGAPPPETGLRGFWHYAGDGSHPRPARPGPLAAGVEDDADAAPAGGRTAGKDSDDYSSLMSRSQAFVAAQVLSAFDFSASRCVLDVGGGEAVFAEALARRYPQLSITVFDLPEVAERAGLRIEHLGLSAQISAAGGSFLCDPLPSGADLVTLVRVLHDHDDPVVSDLLRRVHDALPPGGRILVAEPMAVGSATRGVEAYFACYFLAMGQGRLRSPVEIAGLLEAAGFVQVRRLRVNLPLLTGAVTARRAG